MYNNDNEQKEVILFPWLVFKLNESLYTINSKIITSIVMMPEKIAQVPNIPDYMSGLIHLRGSVIPLLDLKILFGMRHDEETYDRLKGMVVVLEKDNTYVGIIVDEVLSVENIEPFEETEEIKDLCKGKYINGVAKSEKNKDVLLILDGEMIMSMSDIIDIKDLK